MQWVRQAGLLSAFLLFATTHASVLTAERLLTAPRPDSGVANPSGSRALVGVKTFSFKADSYDNVLYHIKLPVGHDIKNVAPLSSKLDIVSKNTSAGIWLTDDVAAYVDSDTNTLYARDLSAGKVENKEDDWDVVGVFPASVETIQVARKGKDLATLVFSAQVYGDGDIEAVEMHDESEAVKEWDRVKVYDTTFIRHWDRWLYPGKRSQLFAIDLQVDSKTSKWSFNGKVRNLLKNTSLEAPVPPFGDEGDYSVSSDHVVFTSKDPGLNPAWHTKQNIYIVNLDGASPPIQVTKGKHGATSSPTFSPDGKLVAWLQMDRDGFESDRRKIHFKSIDGSSEPSVLAGDWHLSPSSVSFSADSSKIIGIVEDHEQNRVFEIGLGPSLKGEVKMLSSYGGVASVTPFSDHSILISASSLVDPTDLYLISPHASFSEELGTNALRLTNFGQAKESSLADVDLGRDPEQFHYPGAGGRDSYGWIHYPPGYDDSKTYALAVIIHGGPEGAFTNSWSYRWNPAVFAAEGFFVITIDPAGSSGFGQAYQEEILGNWGGAPFLDIRAGVKHILHRFSNVDPERVVAAGASYGGYMINWINGHNEDKLFKGLVCHDGVFSTLSTFYSTEELYFPYFEFGGLPWEKRHEYEKWSPEKFTQNWETPQLTIAGGRDYRLPESEGISVFNTLQRRGVPSRLVYFPDENHWVLEPKNSLKWHEEVLGWLLKYSSPRSDDAAAAAASPLVFQHS
ncbi:hypothetical protein CBS101457_000055 [Exobasidium rhododendri]|nr:hypothetical protein CBS101457_000055 [Exobasidium rhododendri]